MRRFARWYARRIVNVNVNIVLAGLLALPPTALVVHFSRYWGVDDHDKVLILAITWVTDIIFDVAIYFVLHWAANHGSWRNAWLDKAEHVIVEPAYKGMSFVHDAGLVQFQRLVISPVLYVLWLGSQYMLMKAGMDRVPAMALGWVLGISTARTIHTLWMLREERISRERRLSARLLCTRCGYDLSLVTSEACPDCGEPIRRVPPPGVMRDPESAPTPRSREPEPKTHAASPGT
ncbi:MAG: hypothetical protein HRU70_04695 [Phycisphaeraceae bacterium]|nr:MAG: hypothetical protein HRU70_04695 [Phycisphaeraceae bacterium]